MKTKLLMSIAIAIAIIFALKAIAQDDFIAVVNCVDELNKQYKFTTLDKMNIIDGGEIPELVFDIETADIAKLNVSVESKGNSIMSKDLETLLNIPSNINNIIINDNNESDLLYFSIWSDVYSITINFNKDYIKTILNNFRFNDVKQPILLEKIYEVLSGSNNEKEKKFHEYFDEIVSTKSSREIFLDALDFDSDWREKENKNIYRTLASMTPRVIFDGYGWNSSKDVLKFERENDTIYAIPLYKEAYDVFCFEKNAKNRYRDGKCLFKLEICITNEDCNETAIDIVKRLIATRRVKHAQKQITTKINEDTSKPNYTDLLEINLQPDKSQDGIKIRFAEIPPGSYYMSITEITQQQYEAVMGNNPSSEKDSNKPVDNISWKNAMQFCEKASRISGKNITLPTEAQWEYACRAGTESEYYFGNDADILDEYSWYADNSDWEMHVVGGKKPNKYGLYDMYGNASEYCLDWFYENNHTAGNVAPKENAGTHPKVVRGGHYDSLAENCRSSSRSFTANTAYRSLGQGFRVVLLENN